MRKKLVRNKIPNIIKESGRKPIFRKAPKKDLPHLLYNKMIEELNEFFEEPSVEEAADLYEVLRTLAWLHKLSMSDVVKQADEKRTLKGDFKRGLVLEDII